MGEQRASEIEGLVLAWYNQPSTRFESFVRAHDALAVRELLEVSRVEEDPRCSRV